MSQWSSALAAIAVALLTVAAVLVIPWADRRRARRKIESIGGRVVSVESHTPSFRRRIRAERNTTFWLVRYVSRTGERRVARCATGIFGTKIEEDEPDSAAQG